MQQIRLVGGALVTARVERSPLPGTVMLMLLGEDAPRIFRREDVRVLG
jgi:hypothetical protein